jgi:integrase
VAGGYYFDANKVVHGFLYSPDGEITVIDFRGAAQGPNLVKRRLDWWRIPRSVSMAKANKLRVLPLPPETAQLLDHCLHLERPAHCGTALFVSLKGHARGRRMTPARLRSLFRHHRGTTGVTKANPTALVDTRLPLT